MKMEDTLQMPPVLGETAENPEKEIVSESSPSEKGFFEKAKDVLGNEEIQKQLLKTGIGTAASIAGVKSFYDVPAYLRQRYMVRGILGQGEGLGGSVENVISSSQEIDRGEKAIDAEDRPREVRDAITDLNKRLEMTKEGSQKGSEQRNLVAQLLNENRIKDKMSKEQRGEQVTNILDNYTTTKVTGMQAARETLNTGLVATGAFALRGVSYGVLDGVERYQKLKKGGEKVSIAKDIIIGSIKETLQEAVGLDSSGEKKRGAKVLDVIKAWGKIARYVGIGATVEFNPNAMGESIDNLSNAFSGKTDIHEATQNFTVINEAVSGIKKVAHGAVDLVSPTEAYADEIPSVAHLEVGATLNGGAHVDNIGPDGTVFLSSKGGGTIELHPVGTNGVYKFGPEGHEDYAKIADGKLTKLEASGLDKIPNESHVHNLEGKGGLKHEDIKGAVNHENNINVGNRKIEIGFGNNKHTIIGEALGKDGKFIYPGGEFTVDASGKVTDILDFKEVQGHLDKDLKFLSPEDQAMLEKIPKGGKNLEFYEKAREAMNHIDRLRVESTPGHAVITLIDRGHELKEAIPLPPGCSIVEKGQTPSGKILELIYTDKSGQQNILYSGELHRTVDLDGNEHISIQKDASELIGLDAKTLEHAFAPKLYEFMQAKKILGMINDAQADPEHVVADFGHDNIKGNFDLQHLQEELKEKGDIRFSAQSYTEVHEGMATEDVIAIKEVEGGGAVHGHISAENITVSGEADTPEKAVLVAMHNMNDSAGVNVDGATKVVDNMVEKDIVTTAANNFIDINAIKVSQNIAEDGSIKYIASVTGHAA